MDRSTAASFVIQLLAAYLILAAPWLAYRNAAGRRGAEHVPKTRLYRQVLLKQLLVAAAICWLWLSGGIPAAKLGLWGQRGWPVSIGLAAAIGILMLWSAMRLRSKAGEVRERLRVRAGALLPDSAHELRWFALLSVAGGISEELAYRGFLFYYLDNYIPGAGLTGIVLLSSLIFGVAHLYQGWRGVAAAGASGLILAGLYLLGGSLLLPTVAHIMGNMRVSIIFWPGAATADESEVPAGTADR